MSTTATVQPQSDNGGENGENGENGNGTEPPPSKGAINPRTLAVIGAIALVFLFLRNRGDI